MITRYKLFIESISQTLDYDPESKSMIGVYKILNTDSENTTIENKQEFQEFKGRRPLIYMTDKLSAHRYTRIIKLPTSQIKIGKDMGEGYFEIVIPYNLYLSHKKELAIQKLDNSKDEYKIVDK